MHLSGLVLDVYDDQSGETLKSIYPSCDAFPPMVKTAHVLTSEEREVLPDDVFALVLSNGDGAAIRKYACVDPGNTVLSVEYFLSNRGKLPGEAQKVAAANLITACGWYGIEPPEELSKVALLGHAASLGLNLATTIPAARLEAKDRMATARQSGGVINPDVVKHAEASGTTLMPNQQDTNPVVPKAVVKKTASVGHLVPHHGRGEKGEQLEEGAWVKGKQPAPRHHGQLVPHVNVQGAEPPSQTKLKVSSCTALAGRYPLDSYAQVKAASAYFDENWQGFSPYDRHMYCMNMVNRADDLGIPVSEPARKYASATYAPAEEIELALSMRRTLLPSEGVELLDKLASIRPTLAPDVFACALEELDRANNLHFYYDREIYDPFCSTFGLEKTAEYSATIGTEYTNEALLKELSVSAYALIKKRFGEDLADEFRKDPVAIFKSLPLEQKTIIMRLAGDQQPSRGDS